MPKKKHARDGDLSSNVQDYRREQATRKNNPPAISTVDATSPSRFLKTSGGDAASTSSYSWFDPNEPIGYVAGGNLPHWRQDGVLYFVTFRTADSMPAERVQQWFDERKACLARHPEPHDASTRAEYDRLFSARWENWLDECHGECLMKRPDVKVVVEHALRYFDGERYTVGEFKVMPNHVHVLVTPLATHELSDIVQNWKSFTAHEINRMRKRKGTFWQKESFDHIVRGPEELERIECYIREQGINTTSVDATSSSRSSSGEDAASMATCKNNPPAISTVDAMSPSRFLKTSGGDAAST